MLTRVHVQRHDAPKEAPAPAAAPVLKKTPGSKSTIAAPAAAAAVPAWKQRAQQAAEAPAEEEAAAEETDLERLSRIMGATVDSESDVQYMQESDIPGDAALPDKLWARKFIQQSKSGGAPAAPATKKASAPAPAKAGTA